MIWQSLTMLMVMDDITKHLSVFMYIPDLKDHLNKGLCMIHHHNRAWLLPWCPCRSHRSQEESRTAATQPCSSRTLVTLANRQQCQQPLDNCSLMRCGLSPNRLPPPIKRFLHKRLLCPHSTLGTQCVTARKSGLSKPKSSTSTNPEGEKRSMPLPLRPTDFVLPAV